MSTINLLPDDYMERRRQYRANVMCLGLFVVIIAGVIGAWFVSERSRTHTLQVQQRVNDSYADAVKLIEQMKHLRRQKQTMLAKAEVAASLVERVPRSYLLAQVTNALPKGATLKEFNLVPKRVRVAKPSPGGKGKTKFAKARAKKTTVYETKYVGTIEITGHAATDVQVAQFMANLLRQPLLRSVELGYSQERIINDVAVREFQITTALKSDVDVIDMISGPRQAAKTPPAAPEGTGAES